MSSDNVHTMGLTELFYSSAQYAGSIMLYSILMFVIEYYRNNWTISAKYENLLQPTMQIV